MRAARAWLAAAACLACAAAGLPAVAQQGPGNPLPPGAAFGPPAPAGPGFAILSQERLLRESRRGQALLSELREAEQVLERENQTLSDQLATEERALTALRGSVDPEDFRARADAFDRRVEVIRAERARLAQELARSYDDRAQAFFQSALPVVAELMQDQGIIAILSPEAVILAADWLDITDQAIERLDAAPDP
jgi:Skp family chaperone for outer membrane proteins